MRAPGTARYHEGDPEVGGGVKQLAALCLSQRRDHERLLGEVRELMRVKADQHKVLQAVGAECDALVERLTDAAGQHTLNLLKGEAQAGQMSALEGQLRRPNAALRSKAEFRERLGAGERRAAGEELERLRKRAEVLEEKLKGVSKDRARERQVKGGVLKETVSSLVAVRKEESTLRKRAKEAGAALEAAQAAHRIALAGEQDYFIPIDASEAAEAAAAPGPDDLASLPAVGAPLPGSGAQSSQGPARWPEERRLFEHTSTEVSRLEHLPPNKRRAALLTISRRFQELGHLCRRFHRLLMANHDTLRGGAMSSSDAKDEQQAKRDRTELHSLLQMVRDVMSADALALYLVERPDGEPDPRLRLHVAAIDPEMAEDYPPMAPHVPAGAGLVGYVHSAGTALRVVEAEADGAYVPELDWPGEGRSSATLCIPVRNEGEVGSSEVVGVLKAVGRKGNHGYGFTRDDAFVLRVCATQAGLGLHNAQLFELAEEADGFNRKLIDVTRKLGTKLDMNNLVAAVVDAGAGLVNAEKCRMLLLDRNATPPVLYNPAKPSESYQTVGICGSVAFSGDAVAVPSVADDPKVVPRVDCVGVNAARSMVVVPVLNNLSSTIGVLQVINKKSKSAAFTEQEVVVLRSLATQCGVSVEVAQHFTSTMWERTNSEGMSVHLSVFQALEEVAALVKTASGADSVRLLLVGGGGGVETAGPGQEKFLWTKEGGRRHEWPLGGTKGLACVAATTNSQFNVREARSDKRYDPDGVDDHMSLRVSGLLTIPITRFGTGGGVQEVAAVLQVANTKRTFDRETEQMLGRFCQHIGFTLHNAYNTDCINYFRRQEELFLKVVSEAPTDVRILGSLVESVGKELLGAESCNTLYVESDGVELQYAREGSGLDHWRFYAKTAAAKVIASRSMLCERRNPQHDPGFGAQQVPEQVLCVPMEVHGEQKAPLGAICLQKTSFAVWTKEEAASLMHLAHVCTPLLRRCLGRQ